MKMAVKELEARTERLKTMHAAYVCSLSATPEENATKELMEWAKNSNPSGYGAARLFGRNTYPTDKPEPHGYELYLTLNDSQFRNCRGIQTSEIPGGLYAVLRFRNLENIAFAWKKLLDWIENSSYEPVGLQKGKNGWVGGFEEQVNWQEQKPPTEWVFDLWVQLKE